MNRMFAASGNAPRAARSLPSLSISLFLKDFGASARNLLISPTGENKYETPCASRSAAGAAAVPRVG